MSYETKNVKIGDKIVILHKGCDKVSKYKKRIITHINKDLHLLWGTWSNAVVN